MKKHTEGPWFITDCHVDNGAVQIGSAKDYICQMYALPNDEVSTEENEKEAEANAHLIAAAPELLEACKVALLCFDPEYRKFTKETVKAILTNAINKAKGGNSK